MAHSYETGKLQIEEETHRLSHREKRSQRCWQQKKKNVLYKKQQCHSVNLKSNVKPAPIFYV